MNPTPHTESGPDGQPPTAVAYTMRSGKGGSAKSSTHHHIAGEASAQGIPTLGGDLDPERNWTRRMAAGGVLNPDAPGIGSVLRAAGVRAGSEGLDDQAAARGAEQLLKCIQPTHWEGFWFIPGDDDLHDVAQAPMQPADLWILREIAEVAGLYEQFRLIGWDTGGRRGPIVNVASYGSDVAFGSVIGELASLEKAGEAKEAVGRMQRAHPDLRWGGVIVTGVDLRADVNKLILEDARRKFGDEIIAVWPYWLAVWHEAYSLGDRLADLKQNDRVQVARRMVDAVLHEHILRDQPAQPLIDSRAELARLKEARA